MRGTHSILKALSLMSMLACAACAGSRGATVSSPAPGGAPHRQAIVLPNVQPNPIYSPAVRTGNLIFFAGQIGATNETRAMQQGRLEAETRNALNNLENIMRAAAVTRADIVKCTVFLADIADYNAMNGVYREFFSESPPARTAVAVAGLPAQARIEIECFAAAR